MLSLRPTMWHTISGIETWRLTAQAAQPRHGSYAPSHRHTQPATAAQVGTSGFRVPSAVPEVVKASRPLRISAGARPPMTSPSRVYLAFPPVQILCITFNLKGTLVASRVVSQLAALRFSTPSINSYFALPPLSSLSIPAFSHSRILVLSFVPYILIFWISDPSILSL
jgi:hypothetical protein